MTAHSPSRRAVLSAAALAAAPAASRAADPAPAFRPPMAATFPLQAPRTELVWEAYADLDPMIDMGDSPLGHRRMIPVRGGSFVGPKIKGKVLPGGADRQLVRKDGVTLLDALYEMQTDDGAVLTIRNRVTVDPAAKPQPYIRSSVEVTAPEGPHAWLNRAVFVGTLHPLPPEKKAVVIRVYEVV
jgi:hypothetical protein